MTGGRRLRVEATPSTVTYALSGDGPSVQIGHHGQPITLTDGCAETRDIPPLPDRPEPTSRPGANQELLALGVSNAGAGLLRGFPVGDDSDS